MRNLKKILALALAFVMVFALMSGLVSAADDTLTATAAADSADLRLVKALGIMTDGRANDAVKRGEFAKMMCVAKIGTALNITSLTGGNFFADEANHWSAPYVNYLKSFKLVDGVSATEFKPESNITVLQALKMCLSILGFNYAKDVDRLDYGTDWEGWTINYALAAGLLDDALLAKVIDINALCTREVAAEIIVNALFANPVSFVTLAGGYEALKSENPLATKVFGGVFAVKGTVTDADPKNKDFEIDDDGFEGAVVSMKALGATAEFYAKVVDKKAVAVTEPVITNANVIAVKASALVKYENGGLTAYDKDGGKVVAKAKTKVLAKGSAPSCVDDGQTIYFVGPVDKDGFSFGYVRDEACVGTVTNVDKEGTYFIKWTNEDPEADPIEYKKDTVGFKAFSNLTDLAKGDVFVQKKNLDTGLLDVEKLVPSVVTLKGENRTKEYVLASDGTQLKATLAGYENVNDFDKLNGVLEDKTGATSYSVYLWNGGVVKAAVYTAPASTAALTYCVVIDSIEGSKKEEATTWKAEVPAVNAKAQVVFADGTTGIFEVANTVVAPDKNLVYSYVINEGKIVLTLAKNNESNDTYGLLTEINENKTVSTGKTFKPTSATKVLYNTGSGYKLANLADVEFTTKTADNLGFVIGTKTGALYTYSLAIVLDKACVNAKNPIVDTYAYISELGDKVWTKDGYIYDAVKATLQDGTTATWTVAADIAPEKDSFIKKYTVVNGVLTDSKDATSDFAEVATQGAIIDGQYINLADDDKNVKAYSLANGFYTVNGETIPVVDVADGFKTNAYAQFSSLDPNVVVSLWIVK